jgi:hypothetical protein
VLEVREELLGAPGRTIERELALKAVYELDPDLQAAAAANHGGVAPEVKIRRRAGGPAEARRKEGLAQALVRRLARDREPSEVALAQIEREAGRQLRREIREFKGALLRGMARIAAGSEHGHNTLFVCGHTHLAEIVELNERQVYINTGTWTPIIQDIRANRRQEQRFPFLEVLYPDGAERPRGRLLVWQGLGAAPRPWVTTLESEDDDDVDKVTR